MSPLSISLRRMLPSSPTPQQGQTQPWSVPLCRRGTLTPPLPLSQAPCPPGTVPSHQLCPRCLGGGHTSNSWKVSSDSTAAPWVPALVAMALLDLPRAPLLQFGGWQKPPLCQSLPLCPCPLLPKDLSEKATCLYPGSIPGALPGVIPEH